MNTTVQPVNADTQNGEVEEVQPLADDATQEEKDEYTRKVESSNAQLFARLKKEQGFVKRDGKWVKETPAAPVNEAPKPTIEDASKLSQADLFAIIKAGIEEEDIAEVADYAKLKKISVSDALKTTVVKQILAEKAEQRKVADGTNTGPAKRGSAKVSDEALISNAKAGKMPENDDDMNRLIKLQLGIK